jgi:hypothetical protein
MNVNELRFGSPEKLPPRPHVELAAPQTKPDTSAGESASNDPSTVRHARDSEVVRLVRKLQEHPPIRAELVSLAKQKLADGEYLTRTAAAQTVAAMLGD